MAHWYTWHDSFTCMTWLIDVFATTHEYLWRAALVCTHFWFLWMNTQSYLSHDSCTWHDALICVTWLIHVCDVTHWCLCDDSWIFVTWRTHMYVLLIFVNGDSLIYMTWHINVCDMTYSYSWRNALLYVRWLIPKWVHSYVYELCLNASCHEHENDSFIIVTWSIHV